jgi:hypothetical protein
MNRILVFAGAAFVALGMLCTPSQAAIIGLFEGAINIDGTVSNPIAQPPDPVPPEVDLSAFDTGTGLGTITVTIAGLGPHNVHLFVDHEIDEYINTYFNENGLASGTPAAGQSWEIDEPGWVYGDIYVNFENGTLDNSNALPDPLRDDVSMAMGWDFDLGPLDLYARIHFHLSDTEPTASFYLEQRDPDSQASVYFWSDSTIAAIPEPSTFIIWSLLGALGLTIGWWRRRSHGA